ncbi:LppU/SCO3897 family protein, partial [Mycobacterium kansasii]
MRALASVVVAASGIVLGCSSATNLVDLKVGDCLKLGGTPDRPQATKAACGSPDSNFKVVAV